MTRPTPGKAFRDGVCAQRRGGALSGRRLGCAAARGDALDVGRVAVVGGADGARHQRLVVVGHRVDDDRADVEFGRAAVRSCQYRRASIGCVIAGCVRHLGRVGRPPPSLAGDGWADNPHCRARRVPHSRQPAARQAA